MRVVGLRKTPKHDTVIGKVCMDSGGDTVNGKVCMDSGGARSAMPLHRHQKHYGTLCFHPSRINDYATVVI